MKEKIKMILCLCLIIAGLPILMTLVFQGDEILLDTDSNEIQQLLCGPIMNMPCRREKHRRRD